MLHAMQENPLQRWLGRNGIEAKDAAASLGWHPSRVSRLINGGIKADPETLAAINALTGGAVSPSDWVSWVTNGVRGDSRKGKKIRA